jgi:ribosomal protein S30
VVTQNNAPPIMEAAARYIEPRDVLKSVQGQSVKDRRLADVINMILAAGRPLTLTFLRPAPGIEDKLKREEERLLSEQEEYEKRVRAAQQERASPRSAPVSSSPQREAEEALRMKQEREAKVNQILGISNPAAASAPDLRTQHSEPFRGSLSPSPAAGKGGSSRKENGGRRRRRPADEGSPMRHRTVRARVCVCVCVCVCGSVSLSDSLTL